MSHDNKQCSTGGCAAAVWSAALVVVAVVVASAAFLDWRAQERLVIPYGNQANADNAFKLQAIQYDALAKQVAKDPGFFDNVRKQAEGQAAQQASAQGAEQGPTIKQASADQTAAIKKDFYLDGEPKARFTVFEFSDLECPFCKRQHDQGVIEAVKAKFPGEVNRVFKVSPLPFHPLARPAATAVLCAGELGGAEAYYKGIAAIFAEGDPRDGHFEESVPAGLGKKLGLDAKKFETCYKSDKFKAAIDESTAQGASLGVQGTPGNVIFDNTNKNYVLLAGAYPAEQFAAAIEQLKAAK